MHEKKEKKFLTVAPFECAWLKDLRFREAGRGCVAFEAFAHNDVTLVFRENVGSQHYHYKRDSSPHYTVILGSHRNRRLKIEVNGKAVVDVEGIGLCCASAFQSYWICIYDGLISVGKGKYPFQNMVFQWLDSNPNCSVRYIGLSSWDKHVGYRNVNVLPLTQNHVSLWKHVDSGDFEGEEDGDIELEDECRNYDNWGLEHFLESWELADVFFTVGSEERIVPAHKAILVASGNFPLTPLEDVIKLHGVSYPVLRSLLQYIYTGQTQILESQILCLRDLGLQFEVGELVNQCEETIQRFKLNKTLSLDSSEKVELSYPRAQPHCCTIAPASYGLQLKQLYITGNLSDLAIHISDVGFTAHVHKIILSLWSVPFAKMFTNGMKETISSEVSLMDVSPEAFKLMLEFMYSGELSEEVISKDSSVLLLQLLLLADQYGVTILHRECCKILLEHLSEDLVCPILQVVSSIPSCRLIEETCERKFAMHFDYCTTASLDFVMLDETAFGNIIQHPDLTVTSEEKVLNAIVTWGNKTEELCGWEEVDEQMLYSTPEMIFRDRLQSVHDLIRFVRFPLLPYSLLEKLDNSNISKQILTFRNHVKEAIAYIEHGSTIPENNVRFQYRRSSYKELMYLCDGDSNGVLFFAGTSYGKHQWVNPVLSKRITITASSPPSRFTDPKVLVSRTYQGTSFAGPRIEDGRNCSWWMIDLGKDRQLMCNYYTLRLDGSRAYIRHWNFQGSLDGKNWTKLRSHENDQTTCKSGQFASWPITGPNALLPFRFFRVVLSGPNTDASNPWNFCICYFELYGYFR